MEQPEINLAKVDEIIARIGTGTEKVIPILQAIQENFRYLPKEALKYVCEKTDISPTTITGVSTFYSQFRHEPIGQHTIHICTGTACHVKGAELVYDAFRRHLKIKPEADTDQNRLFTLQKVACLGCCTLAPVVQIGSVTYGHIQPNNVPEVIHDFLEREANENGRPKTLRIANKKIENAEIRIGLGSCCIAGGSANVRESLKNSLEAIGIEVPIKRVGCVGMCHQTPLVEVILPNQTNQLYARVQPADVPQIIQRHFKPAGFFQQARQSLSKWIEKFVSLENHRPISTFSIDVRDKPVAAFLGRQKHLATEFSGVIDPTDLDDYRQRGGFEALKHCLTELTSDQIIEIIKQSGLRGRGGAGFPTGQKWEFVRQAPGTLKYIICNGDEGDPGAFMDRMLLESYPYRVIEGMLIAARAVGATAGYFYIRAEYPLAVRRIQEALERCEIAGLLGKNILGADFSLHLNIMEGAGAFVCGEETALIASIEGKRGMPQIRPPFPARQGLWEKPTLVNNVETYALVSWIIRHGAEAFRTTGTEKSAGTKVFALAGKVARGGLIEVPMGITIREIVEDIGGGIAGGRRFKAVQVGGPSGGCIPAELGHTPVDYEALGHVGAMMGSGGLLVLDDSDCMVDIARYFLTFTQDQSCGKCTFCRLGTRRMLDILEKICNGKGQSSDLSLLEELANRTKQASLCGLGKTAPNPVLTTLKYFRHEYEAHIEGRCPAKKCKALITYSISDECIGCTKCAQDCPVGAIQFKPYEKHIIDAAICIRCDTCRQVCPENAVEVN
jgi:NADH:ubiquinone oxidoreductase subunit F (NADH-binding)/NADH:ubiquinone oxidoreductase subunit E